MVTNRVDWPWASKSGHEKAKINYCDNKASQVDRGLGCSKIMFVMVLK